MLLARRKWRRWSLSRSRPYRDSSEKPRSPSPFCRCTSSRRSSSSTSRKSLGDGEEETPGQQPYVQRDGEARRARWRWRRCLEQACKAEGAGRAGGSGNDEAHQWVQQEQHAVAAHAADARERPV